MVAPCFLASMPAPMINHIAALWEIPLAAYVIG
jgi:hypothetical protein